MCRNKQLESVFAGIPGSRYQRSNTSDLSSRRPITPELRESQSSQSLQNRVGQRPLQRDQRIFLTPVNNGCPTIIMVNDPRKILGDIGSVDTEKIAIFGETIDDNIIDNAAIRVAQD